MTLTPRVAIKSQLAPPPPPPPLRLMNRITHTPLAPDGKTMAQIAMRQGDGHIKTATQFPHLPVSFLCVLLRPIRIQKDQHLVARIAGYE